MGYVLFSPIGNTDPIRGDHDGSWLHICRHFQPRVSVIYLTAEMCRKEDAPESDGTRKDLYARTLKLLNKHLFGDRAERYMQLERVRDPGCEDAHSLELFFPAFQDMLLRMHRDYPDDELLVNVSSGTAGMKGALMAVSAMLPFRVYIVQVTDPSRGGDDKPEIVKSDYLVEESFICDRDNEPGAVNRASVQPMNNLALAMRVRELRRLVDEGDYHTAFQEMTSDSLRDLLPPKAVRAAQGAEARCCMRLEEAGKAFQTSGFEPGRALRRHARDILWICAEYLLTMQNDLRRGAYDNFIRKLTPLLANLCEQYLAKIGLDVRKNGVNGDGKWVRERIPEEWLKALDLAFYPCIKDYSALSAANMVPLIEKFGERRAAALSRTLRLAEERVRNRLAHEIVPFGRAEIETALRRTGPDGIRTPEELLAYLREFLEIICPGGPFDADYWRSYEAMNAHICALLRVEGASDAK